MKHKRIVLCTIMLLALALFGSIASACGRTKMDNEKNPFIIATGELDGVFSPFYSTSGYDSQVTGMTQIGMLSIDKEGRTDYGDEVETVARYVNETSVDNRNDNEKQNETGRYESKYYTTYQLVIKNGIKFSDGVDLTYKDVFFNLYMYLDPVYSGSNTLYSTDILGLAAYRTQDPALSMGSFEEDIMLKAFQRRADFLTLYSVDGVLRPGSTPESVLKSDYEVLKKSFKEEELASDWSMFAGGLENYQKEYTNVNGKKLVEEVWQAYLVSWGLCQIEYDELGSDPTKYLNIDYSNHTDAVNKIKADYKKKSAAELENAIKNYCIEQVFTNYFANDGVFKTRSQSFIAGTATGSNYINYIANQIKKEKLAGDKVVQNVSGIRLVHLEQGTTFIDNKKGAAKEVVLDEDHYALEVTIYGVDPKALVNFGFTVAPMHYYSNPDAHNKPSGFTAEKDGYLAFSIGDSSKEDHFGFAFADIDYMDKVVKAVSGLPVGAGTYKATNSKETANVTALGANTGFYASNIVYYVRNEYFYTTAKSESIYNAKIRRLRLQVTNITRLFDAVKTGTVHYADPSAKKETMSELESAKSKKELKYLTTRTNGYGYIGVSARYIPDLDIRRAIMHAMDISLVLQYYPSNLAENIYVPMSSVSWAYPKDAKLRYDSTKGGKFDEDVAKDEINRLRIAAGYTIPSGKGYYTGPQNRKLEYTFTVAGGNTDHPAYLTMQTAANILNKCGFKIKIQTDPFALRKLPSGLLTVWAAAWNSSIDPDMYQVYHKDSQATSINAWGYPYILGKGVTQTGSQTEVDIINELSEVIDDARKVTDEKARTAKYATALNLVMDLAVELPTYQRSDLYVYKSTILDENSLLSNDECSPYMGPLSRIWEVSFVGN